MKSSTTVILEARPTLELPDGRSACLKKEAPARRAPKQAGLICYARGRVRYWTAKEWEQRTCEC
jgi:hypothetical protein